MNSGELITVIKKMLAKGLTSSEKIQLSDEKPMHYLLSRQWEESAGTALDEKVDHEQMWNNIVSACQGGNELRKRNRRKLYLVRIAGCAAMVALLLVGGWTVNRIYPTYTMVMAPVDETMMLTLPDSSKVWLNASGKIRYRNAFGKKREVFLEGEAFFDVVKKPASPFLVHFQEACVEVKGTTFNVKARKQMAEVTLFSGKVAFSAKDIDRAIEMSPSQQVVYDALTHQATLSKIDAQEYDWRLTEYYFTDKPLRDLVRFINRSRGVNLQIKNTAYESLLFSGKIEKQETLSDIIDKICIALDLQQQREGDTIILY